MKFSIVAKKDEGSQQLAKTMRLQLETAGWLYSESECEMIVCVGGDGTLLYGVHQHMKRIKDVHFVCVHTGTLGFFSEYTKDEVAQCIDDLIHKTPQILSSNLLEITLDTSREKIYALNEMRIENIIKSQVLDIFIDDEYFETCKGTGICLSTQAGSTAYNRSLKGAVVDSGLSLMQLSEITGIQHSLQRSLSNPYIMAKERRVTLQSDTFDSALLCYDHLYTELAETKKIECTLSSRSVRFARYRPYSYLKRLKNLY